MAEWRVYYGGELIEAKVYADDVFEAADIIDRNLHFERVEP